MMPSLINEIYHVISYQSKLGNWFTNLGIKSKYLFG